MKPKSDAHSEKAPFWRKPLRDLSKNEWESLCDRCGRCCLVKLEDEDTGKVHFTDIGCRLLDGRTCSCKRYASRQKLVSDCVKLSPAMIDSISWLPPTCAYRLVAEGKDLMWWHPLVSGSYETVHEAGVSVRDRVAANETRVPLSRYPEHIVKWPAQTPPSARARKKENE